MTIMKFLLKWIKSIFGYHVFVNHLLFTLNVFFIYIYVETQIDVIVFFVVL